MASSRHLVVANAVLFLVVTCSSAYDDPAGTYCNRNSQIVAGGPVSINIRIFLGGSIPAATAGAWFSASTYGKGANAVYGLAQCRGELTQAACSQCIQAASVQIQRSCANLSDAQIWYNHCTVRYRQRRFFGRFDTSTGVVMILNQANVADPPALRRVLGNLFDKLNNDAIDPNGGGFAAGQARLSNSDTLYVRSQCTQDLPSFACAECLATAMNRVWNSCVPRRGCRVFISSCAVRYELFPFMIHEIAGQALEKLIIHHEFPQENKSISEGPENL